MIIDEVQSLLKAIPATFATVEGAAELSLLKDAPLATPAAYVIVKDEASGENQRMTGGVLQRTEVDFGVVIVIKNVSDRTGAAATTAVEPLKIATRQALLGQTLAGTDDVITHVSGSLHKAANGELWWEEIFATAYLLEA
jgi:hypothetical protein